MAKRAAFTMVEMLVAVTIFSTIFGIVGMLYVQSTWRTANGLELNKLEGQVRDLDRFMEETIENSTNCQIVSTGLPLLSATALDCSLPAIGNTQDQYGLYSSYLPSSCSSGVVHWGTGMNRFLYFSDTSGKWNTSGNYLWAQETSNSTPPGGQSGTTNFTFYQGNTNLYNWYLIDNLTFSVNATNHTVTYMIHATDLTRTGQPLGTSTDTANSHTVQLTRTVYWRNYPS